jgi:hypothetical protein
VAGALGSTENRQHRAEAAVTSGAGDEAATARRILAQTESRKTHPTAKCCGSDQKTLGEVYDQYGVL